MKLQQRIICLTLLLALLCPLASSCASAETPAATLQAKTAKKQETKEKQ